MCNYTIAFSGLSSWGNWSDLLSLSNLISQFQVGFNRSDEDDNRGSGR